MKLIFVLICLVLSAQSQAWEGYDEPGYEGYTKMADGIMAPFQCTSAVSGLKARFYEGQLQVLKDGRIVSNEKMSSMSQLMLARQVTYISSSITITPGKGQFTFQGAEYSALCGRGI